MPRPATAAAGAADAACLAPRRRRSHDGKSAARTRDLAAEVAASDTRFQPQQQQTAPQFERPQMDIPTPGTQAAAGSDDFWANFAAISEKNRSAAWQILSQAGPDALRSKVLVSEG